MTRADPWHIRAMRIQSITPEIDAVATYTLQFTEPHDVDAYRFNPGQFNMLYLPGIGESAISLSSDPAEPRFWQHTVRTAGTVTHTLSQLQCGDQIGIRGPFGTGWPVELWRGRDVILVAGGIGLAPLRPTIYELLRRQAEYGRLALLYGGRDPDSLLYNSEFRLWEQEGLTVQATVDRAGAHWSGQIGVVTLLLDRWKLASPASTAVALCGPEVMMKYAARSALQRGIPPNQIWVSLERNMQCAVGLCGHCQLGPEFVCREGPVFRYDRVRSLLAVEGL